MCADESSSSGEEEEAVPAQKDAAVVDATVSDMDYLRSRMTRKFDEPASDDDDDAEEEDGNNAGAGLASLPQHTCLKHLNSCVPNQMNSY